MGWLRRRIDRTRYLLRLALEENSSPGKFACAVALGVLVGGSSVPPVFGARTVTAGFLAWLARVNKLTACVAVHLLAPVVWAIVLLEIRIGAAVLGLPAPVFPREPLAVLRLALHMVGAWTVGSLFVAPVLAVAAGLIAYPLAKRYLDRRARRRSAEPPS